MEYRIVVLGAGGVGISDLIRRFIMGTLDSKYDPMIADSYRKSVTIDGRECILDIIATVGVEDWSALRDQYISTGDGYAIAYNITSSESFAAACKLRTSIFRYRNESKHIPIILVGTMCDLECQRAVETSEAKITAEKWNSGFIETSAKTDTNVKELFVELVQRIDIWRESQQMILQEEDRKQKTKKRSWTLL